MTNTVPAVCLILCIVGIIISVCLGYSIWSTVVLGVLALGCLVALGVVPGEAFGRLLERLGRWFGPLP